MASDDAVDDPADAAPGGALTSELFDRCAGVVELDAAQIEGFVSGLFAAWDTEAEALAFVEHCAATPGAVSATVCAALAQLSDGELARNARRVADRSAGSLPPAASALGAARPVQAWQVQAPFGHSVVVGCATGADGVDHAVLAELADDMLTDLQLTGAPDQLFDDEIVGAGSVEVAAIEVGAAIELIEACWRAAHGTIEPTPGMLANQRFARLRFGRVTTDALPLFRADETEVDVSRDMTPKEIAEADRAAVSTLRAALGDASHHEIDTAWADIVRACVPGLSAREREGLLWLEWADWLGVGIGLARGVDRGQPVSGELFVDLVNRCPEVSSTIHADDREYAAWAFEIAIDHLCDAGVVVDGQLTEQGRRRVHASFMAAWSSD